MSKQEVDRNVEDQLDSILSNVTYEGKKINLELLCQNNADAAENERLAALPIKEQFRTILEALPRVANEEGETDDDRFPIDRTTEVFKALRRRVDNFHYITTSQKPAYNHTYYQSKDAAGVNQWFLLPAGTSEKDLPEGTWTWSLTGMMSRPGDHAYKAQKGDPKAWAAFHKANVKTLQNAVRKAWERMMPKIDNGRGADNRASNFEKSLKRNESFHKSQVDNGYEVCSAAVVKHLNKLMLVAVGLAGNKETRQRLETMIIKK